ncbi:Uncharacterised protein [Legionella steigerwaltii]|uniref:Uncharacterized protein n=1 Tax=Legionella steigerwaltii TaxID=460 RepID=A0A378L4A6_9GAMM|nr:hypothetical protein [Legionella steigerwaltii]KTD75389.1 hypothetical protein Lstg_2484 [Legionella steigerwaltii]STY21517.1 Uncharacterised protein [Legionella steigerwaltii]
MFKEMSSSTTISWPDNLHKLAEQYNSLARKYENAQTPQKAEAFLEQIKELGRNLFNNMQKSKDATESYRLKQIVDAIGTGLDSIKKAQTEPVKEEGGEDEELFDQVRARSSAVGSASDVVHSFKDRLEHKSDNPKDDEEEHPHM